MDPVLASWIKELVLRQNLPMNITNGMLNMLPNEPADSESESSMRVRRGFYQRRLAEGLALRVINPYTLGTIETLYALRPLPAAVDAYRVVAIYLTASAADFPRSITDLCAHRIPNLLRSPSTAGLVSPSLDAEVREMELSVRDIKLRTEIMMRNCKSKALEAVRALLEAEYEDVGPPILELVAEVVYGAEDQDEAGSGSQAEAELVGDDDVRGDGAESSSRAEETQTPAQVARQQAAQTPPPVAAAQNQATQTPPAVAQNQPTQTPSGEKAPEMPPQRKEIHMPPGGIEMPRQSKIDGNRLGKGTTPSMNEEQGNSNEALVRDSTVRTNERGDGSKGKAVCPPTLVVNKRRKTRRWSVLEEDTLRHAVLELGKGSWKEILRDHSDVFEGRTEVDLKDKWRNMIR